MESKYHNICGVVGDPGLFRIAEHNAKCSIEDEGLTVDSIRRLHWDMHDDDEVGMLASRTLAPPLFEGAANLVVWSDPPIKSVKSAVQVCEEQPNVFVILLYDADTYDKRSKYLRELDKAGRLHTFGYVRADDLRRWSSSIRMITQVEEVNLSSDAASELFTRGFTKMRRVVLGNGRKGERMTCDLERARQEAIKAQLYAGVDQEVSPEDVRAICSSMHQTETWDFMDSLVHGNVQATIIGWHDLVKDLSDARRMLGLIKSQLELTLKVKAIVEGTPYYEPEEIVEYLGDLPEEDKFDLWDSEDGSSPRRPDPYRIQKILELQARPLWQNVEVAITACLEMHEKLIGNSSSWDPLCINFCLEICSLA